MTKEELRWVLAVPVLLLMLLVVCPAALPDPEPKRTPTPTSAPPDVIFDYSHDLGMQELEAEVEAQQLAIEALVKADAAPPDVRPPVEELDHYRKSAQDVEPVAEQALQRKRVSAKTEGSGTDSAGMEPSDD